MSKRTIHITSLSDLEAEERRVRQRIKKQEAELLIRVKMLPEELVSAAVTKVVAGVFAGDTFRSVIRFVKKIGKTVLSRVFNEAM